MSAVQGDRPVMILAGGTGGHIFPALAVAKVLRARGVPVVWLGAAGRMETRLVPEHGIELDTIEIGGLRGKGALALFGAPVRVMRAVRAAGFVLRRRAPRAVISFGGFAAGPGGLAARLLKLPLLVHEQNRAPGLTNKVLARVARLGMHAAAAGRTHRAHMGLEAMLFYRVAAVVIDRHRQEVVLDIGPVELFAGANETAGLELVAGPGAGAGKQPLGANGRLIPPLQCR
ncbi:glycosyltransferase, partial [Xanthomonas campestris pv. cannae]|nr:glycosyltransferase [Xanthomonas campestris pv. cannae]